ARIPAARRGEGCFISAPSKQVVAPLVADIRARAARLGRDPAEILMFTLVTVIPGETDAASQAKLADYRAHIDHEGALALLSGWTGIDFSRYALDELLRYVKNDAMNSAIEALTVA